MILSYSLKLRAFTYIEVSFFLLVIIILVQAMLYSQTVFTRHSVRSQQREVLFNIAEDLSQSLLVHSLEKEHAVIFHQENVSPFVFDTETECTYPMDYEPFMTLFQLDSNEYVPETTLQVICAQKKLYNTVNPVFHYILYVYQQKDSETTYGYASFYQIEE